ncbi:MAG: hypothetical protein EGQ81_07260 [Akkermansia sp.]|nr:hypothetical protein [Akkermansia sp.]
MINSHMPFFPGRYGWMPERRKNCPVAITAGCRLLQPRTNCKRCRPIIFWGIYEDLPRENMFLPEQEGCRRRKQRENKVTRA